MECSILTVTFVSHTLLQRDHFRRKDRKIWRVTDGEWQNSVFYIQQCSYTCEHIVVVTESTRLMQVQGRQNPSMKSRDECKLPPLAEELLIFDICRERKSQFSLRGWPPVDQPHSSGRPHIRQYMHITTWTWWIKNRQKKMRA